MSNVCPFCDTTQSYRYIYSTTTLRVMYAKNPACKYHVLITPIEHIASIAQLHQQQWNDLSNIISLLDTRCKTQLVDYIGFNLLSNNGDERVNQRVPHAHMHMFLRTSKERVDPIRSPHSNKPPTLTSEDLANLEVLQNIFRDK